MWQNIQINIFFGNPFAHFTKKSYFCGTLKILGDTDEEL